jgi:UDP-N-acetylmuramoylalanine--D-glutamate ligase
MRDNANISYIETANSLLKDKKILILGFGKEGKSSFNFISTLLAPSFITVYDADETRKRDIENYVQGKANVITGEKSLNTINDYDLIFKSPGISMKQLDGIVDISKLTSQTDLMLHIFRNQVVGVTGTKGKSTTSTLIYNLLKRMYTNVLLVGNIGKPPLDYFHKIKKDTIIIFEMSAHQLELSNESPNIAILLNLYEEHLDHYQSITAYYEAKWNIAKYQREGDVLIYNADDPEINTRTNTLNSSAIKIPISKDRIEEYKFLFHSVNNLSLQGKHNQMNLLFVIAIAGIFGIHDELIINTVNSFLGLPHRLQYVGEYKGITFYDDSISTIPEASMIAVSTLKKVETLILGGKDRGISYDVLSDFLNQSSVKNIILVGETRWRLQELFLDTLTGKNIFIVEDYDELPQLIYENTHKGNICLLSPAASSYDMFKNFEERGEYFQEIIKI